MTLHERLSAKWNECKFGVKQRIFNDSIPQTSVQYILSNPNYGDNDKMKDLLSIIDKHTKEFELEALEMSKKILSV